jgi:hypothetical protein
LLNALLHALSIEADLVLVPRFGQAYQELPGLSFNHAISRVNADGKTFWLDCTDEVCRFDFLPPGDSGRNVLVIDGRTSALCRLDSSDSSSNRLSLRGKLRYAEGGRDFSLDLGAVGSGCGDYQLRSAFGQGKERGGALPLLMMICRPASGSFAMEHQNATPVAALDRAFEWRGQGKHVGLLSRFKDSIALHSPFWIPREWDVAIHARRSSLLLNEGYPLTLEEQFEIVMPPETESISLPERAENRQPPLAWTVEWKKKSETALVASFHAELARGELTIEETRSFQHELRELFQALGSDALISSTRSPESSFKTSQN